MKDLQKIKGYFYLLPSFLGFLIFYLIPFIWGIRYSFSFSSFDSTFVGFKNYIDILSSPSFVLALRNNITFMIIGIPLIVVISFIIAYIINEINAPKYIKLAIMLPIAIPSATVAGFFRKVFGTGAFNLIDSKYAMTVVLLIYLWKNTGYNLIIYLVRLDQIDKEIMEAAKIDGANFIHRLRYIIIPLITPATVFVLILSIVNSFKVFKDVYILQGNYPNPEIYMLQHYMNNKFKDLQYEHLTSAAYIFSLVIIGFALLFFLLDRKYSKKVVINR